MTENLPPTSQDQSSAILSAYDQVLAIHDTKKDIDLPRRISISPTNVGLENAHAQKTVTSTILDVREHCRGHLQKTGHLALQSAPNLLPPETFGVTITSDFLAEVSREETTYAPPPLELPARQSVDQFWRSNELGNTNTKIPSWLSDDVQYAAASRPENGSGHHTVQDETRPSLGTVETTPPSISSPSIGDKPIQSPNFTDSAPSSGDSSGSSNSSSVPTTDSAFSSSTTHSDTCDTPLAAAPLSSVYSIPWALLRLSGFFGSVPPSPGRSIKDSAHGNDAAASVARFPTATQNVQAFGRPSARHCD